MGSAEDLSRLVRCGHWGWGQGDVCRRVLSPCGGRLVARSPWAISASNAGGGDPGSLPKLGSWPSAPRSP